MENLISLTQQYLPDLEKILGNTNAHAHSCSSSYTTSTSDGRIKRRKYCRDIKKRKKLKRSTLESMQAHVNRLNRPTINLVIPSSAYRISSHGIITPPVKPGVVPKYLKKKMIKTDEIQEDQERPSAGINVVPTHTAKFVNSVQASHKQNFKETKLGRGIKNRSADLEATKDAAATLKKKRDQFLTHLKNLQEELLALKIPEVSLSINSANTDPKPGQKKILIKKTRKSKKPCKTPEKATTKGPDGGTIHKTDRRSSKVAFDSNSSNTLSTNVKAWSKRVQHAMGERNHRQFETAYRTEGTAGILNYAQGPPIISEID